jgi:hypothetical protein
MVKELLLQYKNDKSLIMKSQLTLEATIQGVDVARQISAQEDDVFAQNAVSLHLFFDQRE